MTARHFPPPWTVEGRLPVLWYAITTSSSLLMAISKKSRRGDQRRSCSAKMKQDALPRTLLSSPTCCAGIEWWIGWTIGRLSLRPSSQSALLSSRSSGGSSRYYAGGVRALKRSCLALRKTMSSVFGVKASLTRPRRRSHEKGLTGKRPVVARANSIVAG